MRGRLRRNLRGRGRSIQTGLLFTPERFFFAKRAVNLPIIVRRPEFIAISRYLGKNSASFCGRLELKQDPCMSDLSSLAVISSTASQLPPGWYFDPRIYDIEKRVFFDRG